MTGWAFPCDHLRPLAAGQERDLHPQGLRLVQDPVDVRDLAVVEGPLGLGRKAIAHRIHVHVKDEADRFLPCHGRAGQECPQGHPRPPTRLVNH